MKKIKINLGCGTHYWKGWINVDIDKSLKAEVHTDLNKKFPFPNNYADVIVASHLYEHIDDPFHFIKEIMRVLKPKGTVTFVSPYWNTARAWIDWQHKRAIGFGTLNHRTLREPLGYEMIKQDFVPSSIGKFLPKFLCKKLSYVFGGLVHEIVIVLKKK